MEDKLHSSRKRKRSHEDHGESSNSESSSSTDSEEEDDAGELVTEALDLEIMATLNAIRSKDPRVYDVNSAFYSKITERVDGPRSRSREKPMYLRDYHRETLLNGVNGLPSSVATPLNYNEEQEALKTSILGEINAAAAENIGSDDDAESNDDETFLIATERAKASSSGQIPLDIESADKDPESFLSNFMSSRAWVESDQAAWQPFESDDEEEERRAEEFEEAYNFRFEDPAKSNEKLVSHARDITAKRSVRREDVNPRRKRRDLEREKKDVEKQALALEKARVRKLKIEEVEEKLKRIKRAGGFKGTDLEPGEWAKFLDDSWDDARWEQEMQRRFGDAYYADPDADREVENIESKTSKFKRGLRKPEWDDDIDIKDLVPDFVDEEPASFSLSEEVLDGTEEGADGRAKVKKTSKDYKKVRQEKRKESRKERRVIEKLVDDKVQVDTALFSAGQRKAGTFRYRETSPLSYGLSAHDILMAEDGQLNEFVGLKKLAAFRDPEKKRRDQKHLGKKARLRKWRKETFGDENGPREFIRAPHAQDVDVASVDRGTQGVNGVGRSAEGTRKKRRRPKKNKQEGDLVGPLDEVQ